MPMSIAHQARRLRYLFYMPTYFVGLGIVTHDGKLTGRRTNYYNICFMSFTISCLIVVMVNHYIYPNNAYNLISSTAFWLLFFMKFIILLFICGMTVRKRKLVFRCYKYLLDITRDLAKYDLEIVYPYTSVMFRSLFIYSLAPAVMAYDMYKNNWEINFFSTWCHYVPDFAMSFYMNVIIALLTATATRYLSINYYLKKFTLPDATTLEILQYTMSDNELPPEINGEGKISVKQLFIFHNKLYRLAKRINETTGVELLGLLIVGSLSLLCFLYTIFMDLIRFRLGKSVTGKPYYATDYCALLYVNGILGIIYASNTLMKHSGDTSSYLHAIRTVYPKFNEEVKIYSLQLLQQEISITAAGLFVLDFSALYGFAGSLATYLFILVQLDRGVD